MTTSSTKTQHYRAIILGAGQAGKPLALALAEAGWKTALVERKYLGGTCINYGCTPTKTLIASAEVAQLARRAAEYGVRTGPVEVDYQAVKRRKDELVAQFRKGVEESLEAAENLTIIRGEASFMGPKQIEVQRPEQGTLSLSADCLFIDCGTSPAAPALDGLDTVAWLTSTSVMELDELPEHLLILGGGYIGLEFGQLFRRLGSRVTIIQKGPQLLENEDADVADCLADILQEEGIDLLLNTQAKRVQRSESGQVVLHLSQDGQTRQRTGSHLLVATGSTPNTAALRLAEAGIEVDEKGYINVNDQLETTQPGVYALGDIKGGPAFTHISYDDYRVVSQHLLKKGPATIKDRQVPYTVFTDPQLGRVGLSEKEARDRKLNILLARLPVKSVARALETSRTAGLMKVVIDADSEQILGAAILGAEGGEIMSMIQIAMLGQLPYSRLRDAVLAHPTWAESLNTLFTSLEN
ncbi:mercuric reductase [Rhabdobacter roseus]|uniref:Pyruvate/2-oxoglutarate dehydrogenase complex dihydrolipoamide dehydrogenase (E3) component n=1 Tax=Rhabdobacter roseus TaxID=1655419 RepID=A0A840TV71_9BACT|nr:mercuric reductase [Rhabdobacter roseus]MBB5283569.1 pyruvate/2-oxoglutarate dehydrogenase complex dihydrolipoamide dehydrogenase (E3) component [Rhabdobacter roseus]